MGIFSMGFSDWWAQWGALSKLQLVGSWAVKRQGCMSMESSDCLGTVVYRGGQCCLLSIESFDWWVVVVY